jgi:zinc protease
MAMDNPDQIANTIAQSVWLTGNPESTNNFYALLEKVTAQDIMRVAKKYYVPERLTIGTIGPKDDGGVK